MSDVTVLVVDDEEDVTDLYAQLLDDHYQVRKAYGGHEALTTLANANGDVDVVLLDRQMPELDGDETLARIREAEYDCRVAMVTAVDPDFDVVEMPFDAYVTKPLSGADLKDVVDRLLARQSYAADVQHHFSLAARKAALEAEKSQAELASSDEYAALTARLEELRTGLEGHTPPSDDAEEWDALLKEVVDGRNRP